MAKRFFETALLDEDWYLIMPTEYKLFWQWVILKCDHAGFFRPNVELFNRFNGVQIDLNQALKYYNSESEKPKIRVLPNGKWFIEKFISFQYGNKLNPANRLHFSIIELCGQNDLKLNSIRGLIEVKGSSNSHQEDPNEGVKDKDKDKDKDKIKGGVGENDFETFWNSYPKKKSKGDAEKAWKKIKITKELFNKIIQSLETEKKSNEWIKDGGQFIPYPASWLNSKGWENVVEINNNQQKERQIGDRDKLFSV